MSKTSNSKNNSRELIICKGLQSPQNKIRSIVAANAVQNEIISSTETAEINKYNSSITRITSILYPVSIIKYSPIVHDKGVF